MTRGCPSHRCGQWVDGPRAHPLKDLRVLKGSCSFHGHCCHTEGWCTHLLPICPVLARKARGTLEEKGEEGPC